MGVLDGKAAIVTGSARGIGRATAELLAEHGVRVLVDDLDGGVAEQAAAEILSLPLFPHMTDEQVAAVCRAVQEAVFEEGLDA